MGSLLRSGTHKWTREEEKESMPRTADTHSIVYVRFILRCFYEWIRFFCLAIFLLLLLQPMPSGVTVSWTEFVEGKIQRNAFFSVYAYNYHVTITFFVFTQSVRTIFIRLFIFYFIFTTGIDQLQQQFRSLGSLAEDVNFLLLSLVVVVEKKYSNTRRNEPEQAFSVAIHLFVFCLVRACEILPPIGFSNEFQINHKVTTILLRVSSY